MNWFLQILLIIISLFIVSAEANAQVSPAISGEFSNVKFQDFVKHVEKETSYKFYYLPQDVDSIIVTLSIDKKNLTEVLDSLLPNNLYFAIDHRNNVFISGEREISTAIFNEVEKEHSDLNQPKPNSEIPQARVESQGLAQALENKVIEFGTKSSDETGKATISGIIKDINTGEPVLGAVVYVEETRTVAVTDIFGFYTLTLPKGQHLLRIQSVGMTDTKRTIVLNDNGKLDILLHVEVQGLKEVLVEAERNKNVAGLQMGQERLTIKAIKQIPTVFGETDILRAMLTIPGVKTVGEASTGFNVRGGSSDQNLMLLNDAVIYNPSHLFGFFSAINPDVVKSVELYKGHIPAKFGGRLSSVFEINTREGNKKKYIVSGGIGLLTGRLTVEGPVIKDKSSLVISGRSTYSNWLLKRLETSTFRGSANFNDIMLHYNHEFNEKDNLFLTAYLSNDKFRFSGDTTYGYRNNIYVAKWAHRYNAKIYSTFTGSYSRYAYDIEDSGSPLNAYKLRFDVQQYNFKADQTLFLNAKHTLEFGASALYYNLSPGKYTPSGEISLAVPDILESEKALENAVYISDRYDVTTRFTLNLGLRYSHYSYLGPKSVYSYPDNSQRSTLSISDTNVYGGGQVIKTYQGPEIRASARYLITESSSLKLSYNTLRQYIHMMSNTTAISPTDIWKLSDPNIKPTFGDQISLGIYNNLKANMFETSVEVYYKNLKNYIDYKGGAVLIRNRHIETDIISTKGKAYGVEVSLKKITGIFTGWIGYTYSRTLLQSDGSNGGENVNQGKWYPANFDKPHDVTFVGNYKVSHRLNFSLNLAYSTGRPITYPIAMYEVDGVNRVLYGERNQYRIPDYFRVDISANVEGNHLVKKLAHSSWTFSIYNLFGRKNPYSVFFKSEGGKINGYKLSIFGQPIPTVTYNFKF